MNYTKFLKNVKRHNTTKGAVENKKEKFKLVLTDEKIQISSEILKDINKTKILIQNFLRIGKIYKNLKLDYKFDIDEYMAYFLKDKNEFMKEFKLYIDKEGRNLHQLNRKNYLAILEILKSEIDLVLKDFKVLKQKMLKKISKKENFWKIKESFLKNQNHNISDSTHSTTQRESLSNILSLNLKNLPNPFKTKEENILEKSKNTKKKENTEINMIHLNEESHKEEEIYRETENTMSMFKESEQKDFEKTKQILFELSDLMTNFSAKVIEHQQITQTSKYKNKNSFDECNTIFN